MSKKCLTQGCNRIEMERTTCQGSCPNLFDMFEVVTKRSKNYIREGFHPIWAQDIFLFFCPMGVLKIVFERILEANFSLSSNLLRCEKVKPAAFTESHTNSAAICMLLPSRMPRHWLLDKMSSEFFQSFWQKNDICHQNSSRIPIEKQQMAAEFFKLPIGNVTDFISVI